LHTDGEGRNACDMAAHVVELDVIQNIWELTKERLTTEEIENGMLLRTDDRRWKAWRIAAYWG